MWNADQLFQYKKSGIAPSLVKKASTLLNKSRLVDNQKATLQTEYNNILDQLEAKTVAKAIKDFKEQSGIEIKSAYIAMPKFTGKTVNVIVQAVKLNHKKEPYLLCAIVGRNGQIRETKDFYVAGWDFMPAAVAKAKA